MSESSLRYGEGPFEPAQLSAWADAIEEGYREFDHGGDMAKSIIVAFLKTTSRLCPGILPIFCFDGNDLAGIVGYSHNGGEKINLFTLAVLPKHQRNGIGSRLLAMVKDKARGRATIFSASGVLDPAHETLKRAGFWPITNSRGEIIYKWSDLPEQQNDRLPEDTG